MLQRVVAEAVKMLDTTINELMRARDAACLGAPLRSLGLDPVMACWLKYKLSVCIEDPSVWTDPSTSVTATKKTVAEVIRRLMRPRDELATNQIAYICKAKCKKAGGIAYVRVRDDAGNCLTGTPREIVHLCPAFWSDAMAPYREQAIIHEAVHLTHCAGGIEDRRIAVTIGSPTCVAQFVAATNGKKLDPFEGFPCGTTNRCGAIPADMPENCGAALGAPSLPQG
jgi:hypothetical protein